mmetsp:Transcript_12783/g.23186  ORF Transcript_12783/g.23186 Transcript_12783/m.23186 type:complete len:103 (+) Transcript_12783:1098-1406(+)
MSTAELFFASDEQAVVTVQLSDVRLAKAFYAQESGVAAIQNRLRELVAILYGTSTGTHIGTFHPLPCRRRRQHILEAACTAFQLWQILHKFQMQYQVWRLKS